MSEEFCKESERKYMSQNVKYMTLGELVTFVFLLPKKQSVAEIERFE
jgi:hypothetical protein